MLRPWQKCSFPELLLCWPHGLSQLSASQAFHYGFFSFIELIPYVLAWAYVLVSCSFTAVFLCWIALLYWLVPLLICSWLNRSFPERVLHEPFLYRIVPLLTKRAVLNHSSFELFLCSFAKSVHRIFSTKFLLKMPISNAHMFDNN